MRRNVIQAGLFAAVLVSPVALFLITKSGLYYAHRIKLPLVEPVLWVLFVVWAAGAWRTRRERSVRLPPPAVGAFLLAVGLSTVASRESFASCREFVQYFDYFCVAYILFLNARGGARDSILAWNAVPILAGAVILYGVVQLAGHRREAYLVSSLLDDRNVLGAYLAILLPVVYGMLLQERRRIVALTMSMMLAAGFLIDTAPVSLVVLIAVLPLMHVTGRIRFKWRSAIVFGAAAVAVVANVDFGDRRSLFFEPKTIESYRLSLERNIGMTARKEFSLRDLGGGTTLLLSSSAAMPEYGSELYRAYVDNELRARGRELFVSGGRDHIRQRFLEWRAALYVLEENPMFGAGPGTYQHSIGYQYRFFPRLNTLEPSTQNGFLVTASTTGLIGLSCFVWMLGSLFCAGWRGLRGAASEMERTKSLGLIGALASFTVVNLFYDAVSNHATLFLFVLVAALITIRHGSPQKHQLA